MRIATQSACAAAKLAADRHVSWCRASQRIWVVLLNAFMLAAGGFGTVPWISWTHKGEPMSH